MTERRFESGTGRRQMPDSRSDGSYRALPWALASSESPDFCHSALLASTEQSAVLAGAQHLARPFEQPMWGLAFDQETWRNETSWDLARIGGIGVYGGNGPCTKADLGERCGPGRVVPYLLWRHASP